MKTLKIYYREVAEKTGFKKFAFKKARQYVVYLGDEIIYQTDHFNNFVKNPKCKNHGSLILKTRSEKVAKGFFEKARVNQEEFKVHQVVIKSLNKGEQK